MDGGESGRLGVDSGVLPKRELVVDCGGSPKRGLVVDRGRSKSGEGTRAGLSALKRRLRALAAVARLEDPDADEGETSCGG